MFVSCSFLTRCLATCTALFVCALAACSGPPAAPTMTSPASNDALDLALADADANGPCETPPPDDCADDITVRSYSATGARVAGSCTYSPEYTVCPAPYGGVGRCSAGTCDFTCAAGYERVGTSCIATDPVVQVAVGAGHSCALLQSGVVKCWGQNDNGQLGDGTFTARPAPTLVTGLSGVKKLALGLSHSCALLSSGTVMCWGADDLNQLGQNDGPGTGSPTPLAVPGPTNVIDIAAGYAHTCSLPEAGFLVRCWGNNEDGQLGDGTLTSYWAPVAVPDLSGVAQLALGAEHSCARLDSSKVKCWGGNLWGQLGDGTTTRRLEPTEVSGLVGATELSVNQTHSCAVVDSGDVKCWGGNGSGELGINSSDTFAYTPRTVVSLPAVREVSAGYELGCAGLVSGGVSCWGTNDNGQIGDGTMSWTKPVPTSTNLGGVVQLASKAFHSCARLTTGEVRCWGKNDHGQLGDGTTLDRSMPVSVFGL